MKKASSTRPRKATELAGPETPPANIPGQMSIFDIIVEPEIRSRALAELRTLRQRLWNDTMRERYGEKWIDRALPPT